MVLEGKSWSLRGAFSAGHTHSIKPLSRPLATVDRAPRHGSPDRHVDGFGGRNCTLPQEPLAKSRTLSLHLTVTRRQNTGIVVTFCKGSYLYDIHTKILTGEVRCLELALKYSTKTKWGQERQMRKEY